MEVVKLNESGKEKVIRNEILAGLFFGAIIGMSIAIFATVLLNVTFPLLSLVGNILVSLTTVVVWIGFVMIASILYYKLLPETVWRDIGFFIGLFIIIGLMNYIYIVLSYNIDVLYSSPGFIQVPALVMIGSCLGVGIIMGLKKEKAKEVAQ